jgi:hypothetical protein
MIILNDKKMCYENFSNIIIMNTMEKENLNPFPKPPASENNRLTATLFFLIPSQLIINTCCYILLY